MSEADRRGEDDPVLEALWSRVVAAWDDEKPHAALLEHAARAQRLPEIAARYRQLEGDPAKGAMAKRQLGAIVQSATHALLSMKMPKPEGTPLPITLSAFGVVA